MCLPKRLKNIKHHFEISWFKFAFTDFGALAILNVIKLNVPNLVDFLPEYLGFDASFA